MRLKQLKIKNFKSLKKISFTPSGFSAIVGANASGKTNFAKALSFLSEVYEIGLERAILNAGGYENIALRKQRRSKAALEFEIILTFEQDDLRNSPGMGRSVILNQTEISHKFSLIAVGGGIRADFKITFEELKIIDLSESQNGTILLHFTRDDLGKIELKKVDNKIKERYEQSPYFLLSKRSKGKRNQQKLFDFQEEITPEQDLVLLNLPIDLRYLARYSGIENAISLFHGTVARFKVFQLSPFLARKNSPPIPNPFLTPTGENLPTTVDLLKRTSPKQWQLIIEKMKEIVPSLNDVSTDYVYTRELALFFEEEGVGRPWRAEEVSDGTILALALLVAAFERRTTLTFFDEVENSLHPWILRTVIETLRDVSKNKNVILTTHSPILVDLLSPDELWIIYRKNGESHLRKLTEIDTQIEADWKDGKYKLSTYLDSGYIGQYVPGGVF